MRLGLKSCSLGFSYIFSKCLIIIAFTADGHHDVSLLHDVLPGSLIEDSHKLHIVDSESVADHSVGKVVRCDDIVATSHYRVCTFHKVEIVTTRGIVLLWLNERKEAQFLA